MNTIDTVSDVIKGLKDFLISQIDVFTSDNCQTGYPMDAIGDLDEIGDVVARVSVYDFAEAPDLNYAGPPDETYDLGADPPTVTLTRIPRPFRAYFQVNIWCRKVEDGHDLLGTLSALLASHLEFTSRSGASYDLFLEEAVAMDDYTDRGSSKVIRVSVPLWLPDAHDAETLPLVKTLILELNTQTITISNE